MRSRLFTILAAVSLLLFIGAAAFWVRSIWIDDADAVFYNSDLIPEAGGYRITQLEVYWQEKCLKVWVCRSHLPESQSSHGFGSVGWAWDTVHVGNVPRLGFDAAWKRNYVNAESGTTSSSIFLALPNWLLLLLTAGLPAWWLRQARGRHLRKRRMKLGLCLACGYDLRASKERCPECGTPIPPAPAAPARQTVPPS
jgi:hypothetical protein